MVVETSDPDLEKLQPPVPTTKADESTTPAAGWWWYEYYKGKVFFWPAALAVVVVLGSGTALLAVWEGHLDYVLFAVVLLNYCSCTSLLAMLALPDPDRDHGGAGRRWWPRLVLPLAHAVAVQVTLWSMVMAFLAMLVIFLVFVFDLVQSWLSPWTVVTSRGTGRS